MYDEITKLIYENQQIIIRICRGFFTGQADREDLFQEIIYKVLRSFGKFRHESSFTTWLYRISVNTAITYTRQKKRSPNTSGELPDFSEPESGTRDEEDIRQLYRAIDKLSRIEKGIILLYLEERSYEEIAEITGFSVSNVSVRIHRIKKKLKSIFESIS